MRKVLEKAVFNSIQKARLAEQLSAVQINEKAVFNSIQKARARGVCHDACLVLGSIAEGSVMQPMPPISSAEFAASVLPLLVNQWEKECFCRFPGFLKLLSFDFRHYGNTPAELVDSEMVWAAIVGKRFLPLGDWSEATGEPCRVFRCPQCGLELLTRSQDYSINMWPATSRPTDDRIVASTGLYLVGMKYVQRFDPLKVIDFKLALSVEEFLASIARL